jgi:hypothetical protein|tara:strand:+ start:57 stop:800 length:744 start_codon:yes stop_codon:yes gene_type:complete
MWLVEFQRGNNLKSFPFYMEAGGVDGSGELSNPYTPIGEMFPNVYPYNLITEITGDGIAAARLPSGPNAGEWVGSLTTIDIDKGYWVKSSQNIVLDFPGMSAMQTIYNWNYNLRPGNNLISFPFIGDGCFSIDQYLPASYASMLGITGLTGQGVAASLVGGNWVGSLASRGLCQNDAYWLLLQSNFNVEWQWGDGIETMRGNGRNRGRGTRMKPVRFSRKRFHVGGVVHQDCPNGFTDTDEFGNNIC